MPHTREEILGLLETEGDCRLSLYMPTERLGKDVEQNSIRFKNLLREAEQQLEEIEVGGVQEFLQPAQELLRDTAFWQHQEEGLALFRSHHLFKFYRFPWRFSELVFVGDQFHIKPLVAALDSNRDFFLLALSQNEVRLFQGNREKMEEIHLPDTPTSLAEALRFDLPQKELQFHTRGPGRPNPRDAYFFGTGAGDLDVKDAIRRFFQSVSQGVGSRLQGHETPLILAGVDYLFPIYREVNSYPHLVEEGLSGNPANLDAQQLHEKAWVVIEKDIRASIKKAVERCIETAGSDLVSEDLETILSAAYQGRIDTLYVSRCSHYWGHMDRKTADFTPMEEGQAGASDLTNAAAVYTFLKGGTVYALDANQMPGNGKVAAIFRY